MKAHIFASFVCVLKDNKDFNIYIAVKFF